METWTREQYREYIAKKQGKKKGRAQTSLCWLNKHPHGSIMESVECDWHFQRVKDGVISRAKWQHSVEIRIKGKLFKKWKIDFAEWDHAGNISYWECKGWHLNSRDYVLRRDAFVLANPAAKLYINRELWTGKANKKSVKWRMRDVQRVQKRQAQEQRSRRKRIQAFVSAREAEKPADRSPSTNCHS